MNVKIIVIVILTESYWYFGKKLLRSEDMHKYRFQWCFRICWNRHVWTLERSYRCQFEWKAVRYLSRDKILERKVVRYLSGDKIFECWVVRYLSGDKTYERRLVRYLSTDKIRNAKKSNICHIGKKWALNSQIFVQHPNIWMLSREVCLPSNIRM